MHGNRARGHAFEARQRLLRGRAFHPKRIPQIGKTALAVDNSTTMRELVSYSLREDGFAAVTAGRGQEGLDALAGTSVDLIISDLNMPVMDRPTFIKHVRAIDSCKSVPILMLTTQSQQLIKEKPRRPGPPGGW